MKYGSRGQAFAASIPTGPKPASSKDYGEQITGLPPDDPARPYVLRVITTMKLLWRIDVRSNPELMDTAIRQGRAAYATEQAKVPAEPPKQKTPDVLKGPGFVVYYLRVGKYVKIGVSSKLKNRLTGYPPDAKLLATEPGGWDLEKQRHQQFREDLAARFEWYQPSAKLLAHINSLRQTPLTMDDLVQ